MAIPLCRASPTLAGVLGVGALAPAPSRKPPRQFRRGPISDILPSRARSRGVQDLLSVFGARRASRWRAAWSPQAITRLKAFNEVSHDDGSRVSHTCAVGALPRPASIGRL